MGESRMHRTQLLHSKLIHDAFIMYLDLESLSIGFGELDGDCSDKAVRPGNFSKSMNIRQP